jgi:hypothetical protein
MDILLRTSLALALGISQAVAADTEAVIRNTFVNKFLAALRSHDPARFRPLLHPQMLACINGQTREYFDDLFSNEAGVSANRSYGMVRLSPLTAPATLIGLPEDGFHYPVKPTYELRIDLDGGRLQVIRFLAESRGSWYDVFPCPNEKGMAFMHKSIERGIEQGKRASQLAAELKDPMLGELKALVKEDRIMDAVEKYQAATGADLVMSRMVIGVLEKQ